MILSCKIHFTRKRLYIVNNVHEKEAVQYSSCIISVQKEILQIKTSQKDLKPSILEHALNHKHDLLLTQKDKITTHML